MMEFLYQDSLRKKLEGILPQWCPDCKIEVDVKDVACSCGRELLERRYPNGKTGFGVDFCFDDWVVDYCDPVGSAHFDSSFTEHIRDRYGHVNIMGATFAPDQILLSLDPQRYSIKLHEFTLIEKRKNIYYEVNGECFILLNPTYVTEKFHPIISNGSAAKQKTNFFMTKNEEETERSALEEDLNF